MNPEDQVETPQSNEENGGGSNGVENQGQGTLIEWPDGRKLTPEQAKEEYLKLQSDYTKKSSELAERKKSETPKPELPNEKLEVLKELKELGVLTKEDFDAERVKIRQEIEFENDLKSLEKEIDGSDGRPAFKRAEIIAYMQKEQIFNPLKAYKDMHEDKLTEFKIQQYLKAKEGIPNTAEKSSLSTGKQVPSGETKRYKSDKDIAQAISDALRGGSQQ